MHDQAKALNTLLQQHGPEIYAGLSTLGRSLYFPKIGILNQSAEAKKLAHTYNATIGIAIEQGIPMHLPLLSEALPTFAPGDIFPYAPPEGKPALRQAWRQKLLEDNPSLKGKSFGLPIVTHALTHGLSVVGDLFVEEGDALVLPDQNWENYELIFGVRRGAELVTYPLYDDHDHFHVAALRSALLAQKTQGKAIVLLNFPNNPTGYTPYEDEMNAIVATILEAAEAGIRQIVVIDDAYFGLFYDDCVKESIFGRLLGLHPNVLPIKIDGATKEHFVWGFRVGFITYGSTDTTINDVLEQKTIGAMRSVLSSAAHPSQSLIVHALTHPNFAQQRQQKVDILRRRAMRVREILQDPRYERVWHPYPFNSGYFMCLRLLTVPAEALRQHLLQQCGVGAIALGETDLRIAFSCIEEEQLEHLFSLIHEGVLAVEKNF